MRAQACSYKAIYNHLKFGSQPDDFLRRIKPFLAEVVSISHFRPEIARRLSNPFYTRSLIASADGLRAERPADFLVDTLNNLDRALKAPIGLIFINAKRLTSPIDNAEGREIISEAYGVSTAEVKQALDTMKGVDDLNSSLNALERMFPSDEEVTQAVYEAKEEIRRQVRHLEEERPWQGDDHENSHDVPQVAVSSGGRSIFDDLV